MSTSIDFRLCSRAPRMRMTSSMRSDHRLGEALPRAPLPLYLRAAGRMASAAALAGVSVGRDPV
jgi:hypothetical protein